LAVCKSEAGSLAVDDDGQGLYLFAIDQVAAAAVEHAQMTQLPIAHDRLMHDLRQPVELLAHVWV
jgi:hypothetical protein